MVAWSGSCRARFVPWLVGITAVVVLLVMWAATQGAEPAPQWVLWVLAATGLVVVLAGQILGQLTLTVEADGIVIRYGTLGWPVQRFPWSGISAVTAIDVHPMQWGGWGYRWVPWKRGSAAVLRAGEGLRLDRADGRVFVVTVDGAAEAAERSLQFLARH